MCYRVGVGKPVLGIPRVEIIMYDRVGVVKPVLGIARSRDNYV